MPEAGHTSRGISLTGQFGETVPSPIQKAVPEQQRPDVTVSVSASASSASSVLASVTAAMQNLGAAIAGATTAQVAFGAAVEQDEGELECGQVTALQGAIVGQSGNVPQALWRHGKQWMHPDMRCCCGHRLGNGTGMFHHYDKDGLLRCGDPACHCLDFDLDPMSYCSCGHRLGAHQLCETVVGLHPLAVQAGVECHALGCCCDGYVFVPDMARCDCGHLLCQHDEDGHYSECSECSCLGWQPAKPVPYKQANLHAHATNAQPFIEKALLDLEKSIIIGAPVAPDAGPPGPGHLVSAAEKAAMAEHRETLRERVKMAAEISNTTGISLGDVLKAIETLEGRL